MVPKLGTRTFGIWWGAWGVLIALTAGSAAAQSILYDNFRGALSPVKWRAEQDGEGGLELVREIRDGQLLLSHRVLGDTTRSTGFNESVNRLLFQEGRRLTAVQFKVTVQAVAVRGCAVPGSAISRSSAGFLGNFFNDGSSSAAGDDKGDIGAFLVVERRSDSEDPPDVLHVIAGKFRCPTPVCTKEQEVLRDLGTVKIGESVVLQLVWEEINQRFRFRKNRDRAVIIPYTQEIVTRHSFRSIRIRGDAANCAEGAPPVASMSATLDNVLYSP